MKSVIAAMLVLLVSSVAFADDAPGSYAAAKAIWLRSRDTKNYQNYAAEFSQFNATVLADIQILAIRQHCERATEVAAAGPLRVVASGPTVDGCTDKDGRLR